MVVGLAARIVRFAIAASRWQFQGPLNRGGFKRGGFPIWTCPSFFVLPFLSFFVLFCPFLFFFVLSRFFWDFPDLLGDGPGIFPIRPFPLSRPIKSTYEEQCRKGPRHNLDLSRKKWGNTRVWKPPGLAPLNNSNRCKLRTAIRDI